ncbi:vacuolar morphogenesis protein 6 [Cladorrhinum sp. PSN259]|nr:vacuolar morphogenesis protein 6 [Cladorrhinum sp. PSN259]
MLSAFTARPIIELKPRDKSKIECILAHGDRVFVGLNTGSLRIYRVNETPPPPSPPSNGNIPGHDHDDDSTATKTQTKKATDLLREEEKFSTRAIEQLAIIKEANILVSLSAYNVSLHDLGTFEPLEAPLPRTKNATTFAVTSNVVMDPATGIPEIISRLAVAVKRRLLLWSWHESELSQDVSEIILPEAIRSITWANATQVVCGMNGGFVIVDVETAKIEDIVAPSGVGAPGGQVRFGAASAVGMGYMLGGYMPKPLSAKLAEGELLLAKDINTLFINDKGKALEKRQIPWQAAPEGIGYSYPYILALQAPAKGSLEVRNPDTLSLLQALSLPGAAALHFPPPTVSVAHTGKGFHVLSDRVVWKMDSTDYDSQIDELVKGGKLDEAISILGMLEDALLKNKTETMREIKMMKAEGLFKQKRYRESMDLFNEEDVNAPPERVLKLFPKIIAGELSGIEEEPHNDDSDRESSHGGGDEEAKPEQQQQTDIVSSPQKGGGIGFTKYLMGHRKALNPETASIASSRRSQDGDAQSIRGRSSEDHGQDEKELKASVSELLSYLAGARTRLARVIDPATGKLKPRKTQSGSTEEAFKSLLLSPNDEDDDQLEKELQHTYRIIDTTLFRAYMYSRPTLASSLFRIPNFCDPDVVNESLVEHNRFNELVDFFCGKKLHTQALKLLRKFGSPDFPDPAAPSLHGPQRTVIYLQGLPPEMIDVILEFSEWTLRKDPKLGMDVFLADSENAETLPRDQVIKFLDSIDPALEIQYLEHIVNEWNDLTPDFHNRLVELFVRQLKENKGAAMRAGYMERLVRFLRESRQYSLGRALGLIPKDDPNFYEAQAVVLSNMGQHRQALVIYVFKMKDYAKAEEYCNFIHKTQEPGAQITQLASPTLSAQLSPSIQMAQYASPPSTSAQDTSFGGPDQSKDDPEDAQLSIYHTLLSLYLTPPHPYQPNLEPALDLLSKHGSRLPATSTLKLVPDDLPIAQLESYFRGRMRSANSTVNETRIVAGLRKTSLLASNALLFLGDGVPGGQGGRNRRVVISDERICGTCHKRLGSSVIAVLPDNKVIHYGCLGRGGATAASTAGGSSRPMSPVGSVTSYGGGGGSLRSGGGHSVKGSTYGAWGRGSSERL